MSWSERNVCSPLNVIECISQSGSQSLVIRYYVRIADLPGPMIRRRLDPEVSPTSAEPAGQERLPDPPGFRSGRAAAPAGHGMGMCWAGDIALEEVLAAADRLRRTRKGQDLPAWEEPERPAKGGSRRLTRSRPVEDARAGDLDRKDRTSGSQSPACQPAGHLHPPAQGASDEDQPAEEPAEPEPGVRRPGEQGPRHPRPDTQDPIDQDPADEDPAAERTWRMRTPPLRTCSPRTSCVPLRRASADQC